MQPYNEPLPNLPSAKLLERMYEDKDSAVDPFQYYPTGKNPSFTKKGPGRKHQQGRSTR